MTHGIEDFLLIVDVQNDFCESGALAVPQGDAVVPVINRLIPAFCNVGLTQDWHPADHRSFASANKGRAVFETIDLPYGPQTLWPDHCVQGTQGADFHPDLNSGAAQIIVRKGFRRAIDSYSAFFENDRRTATGLTGYLRDRKIHHIYVVGLAFDYCVRFSAEDARREGFRVTVIEDACRAIDLDGSRAAARTALAETGVTLVSEKDVFA